MTSTPCIAILQDTFNEELGVPRSILGINGYTFLDEILGRLRQVPAITEVVLVTTDRAEDDPLVNAAADRGLHVQRGPWRDLLERIGPVLDARAPEHVVKVHGSNPYVDPNHLRRMIDMHMEKGTDLTTCECRKSIVRGLGAEVIRAQRLQELRTTHLTQFQREFYTQYIKQHPEHFQILEMQSELSRPHYNLAVETPRDYILIKEVAKRLGKDADERRIVEYLDANPHLSEINSRSQGAEVGLEKLLFFPEKAATLQRVFEGELELDPSYPVSVEMSLTSRCQLHCIWCSDLDLRMRENEMLPVQTVLSVAEDLKRHGARGLVIEGGGEPTMHPDFDEIVERCADKGLALGLITNGVRPISPSVMRRFDWIRLSLDCTSRQEFIDLKGVDAFDRVIENLWHMVQNCPIVGVGYVLTNRNHEHLERLIFFLQGLGVSYLHIRPVIDHPELTLDQDISYLKDFTYHSFPVLLDPLKENAGSGNGNLPCASHSLSSVINSSGNVYICGRLNIHRWLEPIGNVSREPFNEIWKSGRRRRQVAMLLNREFCARNCPQCRMTKFNKLLAKQRTVKTRNFI